MRDFRVISSVLSEQLDELGEQLKKKHNIEELGHIAMPSQVTF